MPDINCSQERPKGDALDPKPKKEPNARLYNPSDCSDTNGKDVNIEDRGFLDGKVDKVSGKQLSDENYTTTENNEVNIIQNDTNNVIFKKNSLSGSS